MPYKELESKSALNKLKRRIPYGWDLNIYRGCEHGCKYCYAIYSHDYLNEENYFDVVYYKKDILQNLERELSSSNWKREIVNIGGVTDSYQPIEEKLKIMPEVLKLMIKYKTPIIISTKSNLILRDIDLIRQLSNLTYVNVAFTITTLDEKIREKIEPYGSKTIDRFKALNEFKKTTNASVGVHLMPIIPYLTDNYNNLKEIYRISGKIKVDYVLPGTLYLKGKTKPYFLNFVRNYDINIYNKINNLYEKNSDRHNYKDGLYRVIDKFKKEFNVSSNYMKVLKEKITKKN